MRMRSQIPEKEEVSLVAIIKGIYIYIYIYEIFLSHFV